MKLILNLVITLLCVNALYGMDKLTTKITEKTHILSFKDALLASIEKLAEDCWPVPNPLSPIKQNLNNFKIIARNDDLEQLKSEVLGFPQTLKDRLEYSEKTRNIGGMIGLGSIGLVGISIWLGFSKYSSSYSLLGTCAKKGGCLVLGCMGSLFTCIAGDYYWNDVTRAQNRIDRYAKYQKQVEELFEDKN